MANFTNEESMNCVIQRCESVQSDGVHQYYVFAVIDDNGEYYEWTDNVLSGTATDLEIKTSVCDRLCSNIDKKVPGPVIAHIPSSTIIGSTISSIE